MKHHIPDIHDERLDQLNTWFKKALFSEDLFHDARWLPIRLNLSKWKSLGYSFKQNCQYQYEDYSSDQKRKIYSYYNLISEILLFGKEMKEAASKQQYEKAALYRDYQIDYTKTMTDRQSGDEELIPFFTYEEKTITLKYIDNYFIRLIIQERLRF